MSNFIFNKNYYVFKLGWSVNELITIRVWSLSYSSFYNRTLHHSLRIIYRMVIRNSFVIQLQHFVLICFYRCVEKPNIWITLFFKKNLCIFIFVIFSGNVDIVNGNLKLILGLIWSLIVRYQIGRSKFPPKKLMLAWLKVR